MKRVVDLLIILLFCAWPCNAQSNRVWNYIKTHKVLLAADAALVLSSAAKSASRVHCLNASRNCVNEPNILGNHPSATATWAFDTGVTAGFVALNHVWWWETGKQDAEDLRPLMGAWVIPLTTMNILRVQDNLHYADYLQREHESLRVKLPHYTP